MAFITTIITEDLIKDAKTYLDLVVYPLKSIGNVKETVTTKTFFGLFTDQWSVSPNADAVYFILASNDLIGINDYYDLDDTYVVYTNNELSLIETIASFQGKGTIGLSDKEFATFNKFKKTAIDIAVLEVKNLEDSINA